MEIMSDILQNPLLDDAAISEERDVISHETEAVRKAHDISIWDHLHETAFMGTGLSRTIRGPEENIRSMDRKDLQAFISSQYSADRFVIAAAGAVDHNELVALTETHFGKLPSHPTGSLALPFDAAIFTGSDKRIRFDSMGVSYSMSSSSIFLRTQHLVNLVLSTACTRCTSLPGRIFDLRGCFSHDALAGIQYFSSVVNNVCLTVGFLHILYQTLFDLVCRCFHLLSPIYLSFFRPPHSSECSRLMGPH